MVSLRNGLSGRGRHKRRVWARNQVVAVRLVLRVVWRWDSCSSVVFLCSQYRCMLVVAQMSQRCHHGFAPRGYQVCSSDQTC